MSGTSLKEFSFKDLKIVTGNFSPDNLVGERRFWRVYKGWVDKNTLAPSKSRIGMTVVIKIMNPTYMQGFQEWQNYNAILSDFSLATFGPSSKESHISTNVIGTYGYANPEYIATGNLCLKSDVYSYGVVLLELLTGLRAIDINRPKEQQNLVDWLKPILSRRNMLKTIMDVRMDGQYSSEAAFQAAQLILKCLELDPQLRPSMKKVVEVLKEIEALKDKTKEILPNITPHSTTHHHGQPSK